MKMRRCIVTFEVETNVSLADLKKATITVHTRSGKAWHLPPRKNKPSDVSRIVKAFPDRAIIHYLESNRVNVIRESTKRRGKKGLSDAQFESLKRRSAQRGKKSRWE